MKHRETTNSSLGVAAVRGIPGLVGVLGGMGPLATLDFMRQMLAATPATSDQDHVPVIVSSIPQIPDRTAAYQGNGESPLAAMISSAQRLAQAGAQLLVVPCNTAHLWYDAIEERIGLPMLHLADAAIDEATQQLGPGASLGLLATDATLASALYLNRTRGGVTWMLPTAIEVVEHVTPGIAAVKAGNVDAGRDHLAAAARALIRRGAQGIVMGCTEIPVALRGATDLGPLIDATGALARRAVEWSLAQRA